MVPPQSCWTNGRDDAVFHTVGMFVPVLNFFVAYWLYRDLDELRRRAGLAGIPATGYVVGAIFALPVIYSIALGKVNEFWDARTHGLATRRPGHGPGEGRACVGAALWLLYVASIALVLLFALT